MATAPFLVTDAALDLASLIDVVTNRLASASASAGAVTSFLGTVRNENRGRRVERLEYEAYAPLALKAFERIASEAAERWPETVLAVHHRVGTLAIGEASVAIAAASPHRADAFAVCRYAIERIKQIAPDLETRDLRGGRRLDRGSDGGPGRRGGTADRAGAGMRVTVRLFARLRDLAGAARPRPRTARRRDGARALGWAGSRVSGLRTVSGHGLGRRQRGVCADGRRTC